jgi:hypothetical protein
LEINALIGPAWMKDMPAVAQLSVDTRTLFLGYRGSIAHGMHVPSTDPDSIDDIDLMGVFMGTEAYYLGFGGKDTREVTAEYPTGYYDVVFYEWRKFIHLLLKNNPNVLGMLWLPEYMHHVTSPLWGILVRHRGVFASKLAYKTFGGYAHAQMKKMTRARIDPSTNQELQAIEKEIRRREGAITTAEASNLTGYTLSLSTQQLRERVNELRGYQGYMGPKRRELVERHGYDTKNAAHLIRLLRMGCEFLERGDMYLDRRAEGDAEQLLDIKRGNWSLQDVQSLANTLFIALEAARNASRLPELPDREAAERLLIDGVKEAHGFN